MKNLQYIILISALIPATMMLGLTFVGFTIIMSNFEFSFEFLIAIFSLLLGISGYLGLLLLLKGFHKTNHIKKIVLLFGGLIGFVLFMIYVSPHNILDWLTELNIEGLLGKWPLIVSFAFLLLTIIDLIKNKTR